MHDGNKIERDWFVGTIEVDGYKIPIVGRGSTEGEAKEEALLRVAHVWTQHLGSSEELDQNALTWRPTSLGD